MVKECFSMYVLREGVIFFIAYGANYIKTNR